MTASPLTLLRQHLESRKDSGQSHVRLSLGSLERLSGLRGRRQAALEAAEKAADQALTAPERELPAALPADTDEELITVPEGSREQQLAALAALAERAPEPRQLGTLRDTMVFAVGNPHASLMLIGEAPGAQEERLREPFVGPAGEKLTQILKAMGLGRDDVYISNICKFRPAIDSSEGPQGTGNRKPTAVEMRACLPYVLTEIHIVRPRCIIALGATAAEGLGLEGSVGRLRGQTHTVRGIPTIVTYHPSYVLREEKTGGGTRTKRQVWEDMLLAMEILDMPVSEKQRSYFKGGA